MNDKQLFAIYVSVGTGIIFRYRTSAFFRALNAWVQGIA